MRTKAESIPWHKFLDRPRLPAADSALLQALQGENVLVTGAGGSIGSSLALALAALKPRKLVLLEASENNLHAIEMRLRDADRADAAVSCLGSIGDERLLDEIFTQHRPQWVFHAAAYKHVPLLEAHPLAALSNNVLGTFALSDRSLASGSRLTFVSTDKAAAPESVMGATKRLAESIVLAHGGRALRLGNVLGSRGSVVEIFLQQIANRAPITITHPETRRYFLTIGESVQLILSAALENRGTLHGNTASSALFAADLGRTYLVRDLAEFLVREVGPGQDVTYTFTGLRPGEKTMESLWSGDELPARESRSGLREIETRLSLASQLEIGLEELREAVDNRDAQAAVTLLKRMVPSYRPSEQSLAGIRELVARVRV